jgi:hypothetical protein
MHQLMLNQFVTASHTYNVFVQRKSDFCLVIFFLVVLPDVVGEERSQGDPGLVRKHQVGGQGVDSVEGDGCGCDGAPHKQNLIESLKYLKTCIKFTGFKLTCTQVL